MNGKLDSITELFRRFSPDIYAASHSRNETALWRPHLVVVLNMSWSVMRGNSDTEMLRKISSDIYVVSYSYNETSL